MDFGHAWPLLSQWGAAASGAVLGQLVRERPQHCHCDCDCRGDPALGAALAKQLEHCGPAPPPPVELPPAQSWGPFVLGFSTGVAVTLAVLLAVVLDLLRRGAVRFAGHPHGQPPQAAITCGAPQAEPVQAAVGSGASDAVGTPNTGKGGKRGGKGVVIVPSSEDF